jgi:hypothetical protein
MSSPVTWIAITAADLNDYLVAAQVSALRTAGKAATQTNRDQVFTDVIQRIRRKIENHYILSATANTIPPELRTMACYIIIGALQPSIPGLSLTDDQKRQIETAESDLNRIADGKDAVSEPTDPLTPPETQKNAGVEIVKTPCPQVTREKLRGL